MDADGSEQRRLTHGARASGPTWSPDGTRLAFTLTPAIGYDRNMYVINVDGTGAMPLAATPLAEFAPIRREDRSPIA